MAASWTNIALATSGDAADGSTYAGFSSFTPTVNDYLVAFVAASGTATVAPTLVDSLGGSYSLVTLALLTASADRLYAFVKDTAAVASVQSLTFDCGADPATGAVIALCASPNFAAYGLTPVVQSKTGSNGGAATAPTFDFTSVVNTNNSTLVAAANAANPAALTPPTNWTELADTGHATPARGLETARRNSGFAAQTVLWAAASPSAWGAIGLELDPAAVAANVKRRILAGVWR